MPSVALTLSDFLSARRITAYQLAKELDQYGVARSTAYAIAAGRNQPTLKSLGPIVAALRKLTGEDIQVGDVLSYIPD